MGQQSSSEDGRDEILVVDDSGTDITVIDKQKPERKTIAAHIKNANRARSGLDGYQKSFDRPKKKTRNALESPVEVAPPHISGGRWVYKGTNKNAANVKPERCTIIANNKVEPPVENGGKNVFSFTYQYPLTDVKGTRQYPKNRSPSPIKEIEDMSHFTSNGHFRGGYDGSLEKIRRRNRISTETMERTRIMPNRKIAALDSNIYFPDQPNEDSNSELGINEYNNAVSTIPCDNRCKDINNLFAKLENQSKKTIDGRILRNGITAQMREERAKNLSMFHQNTVGIDPRQRKITNDERYLRESSSQDECNCMCDDYEVKEKYEEREPLHQNESFSVSNCECDSVEIDFANKKTNEKQLLPRKPYPGKNYELPYQHHRKYKHLVNELQNRLTQTKPQQYIDVRNIESLLCSEDCDICKNQLRNKLASHKKPIKHNDSNTCCECKNENDTINVLCPCCLKCKVSTTRRQRLHSPKEPIRPNPPTRLSRASRDVAVHDRRLSEPKHDPSMHDRKSRLNSELLDSFSRVRNSRNIYDNGLLSVDQIVKSKSRQRPSIPEEDGDFRQMASRSKERTRSNGFNGSQRVDADLDIRSRRMLSPTAPEEDGDSIQIIPRRRSRRDTFEEYDGEGIKDAMDHMAKSKQRLSVPENNRLSSQIIRHSKDRNRSAGSNSNNRGISNHSKIKNDIVPYEDNIRKEEERHASNESLHQRIRSKTGSKSLNNDQNHSLRSTSRLSQGRHPSLASINEDDEQHRNGPSRKSINGHNRTAQDTSRMSHSNHPSLNHGNEEDDQNVSGHKRGSLNKNNSRNSQISYYKHPSMRSAIMRSAHEHLEEDENGAAGTTQRNSKSKSGNLDQTKSNISKRTEDPFHSANNMDEKGNKIRSNGPHSSTHNSKSSQHRRSLTSPEDEFEDALDYNENKSKTSRKSMNDNSNHNLRHSSQTSPNEHSMHSSRDDRSTNHINSKISYVKHSSLLEPIDDDRKGNHHSNETHGRKRSAENKNQISKPKSLSTIYEEKPQNSDEMLHSTKNDDRIKHNGGSRHRSANQNSREYYHQHPSVSEETKEQLKNGKPNSKDTRGHRRDKEEDEEQLVSEVYLEDLHATNARNRHGYNNHSAWIRDKNKNWHRV